MNTLWEKLRVTVDRHAQRPALVYGDRSILYAELASNVDTVRRVLGAVQSEPGERFAIIADKTPDVVITILAALHLRMALVVIHPLLKSSQIRHILVDSGATTLLSDSRKAEQLVLNVDVPASLEQLILMPGSAPQDGLCKDTSILDGCRRSNAAATSSAPVVAIHEWQQLIDHVPVTTAAAMRLPTGNDLALILYTSGSTGMPKGVMLSHANLYFGALSVSSYLHNTEHDRILALMPFSFDYGLSQLTTAVCSGAALILFDYLLPRGVTDMVVSQKITGLPAVPHVWDQLVKIEWPDTHELRYVTSTGGRLQSPTIEKLKRTLPQTQIFSMYGFTEAFRATYLCPGQLEQRPESIGKAVPYADILVVDNDGREVDAFEHGELIQSGPLVSQGYWNDPAGTALKIRPRNVDDSAALYAWSGDEAFKDDEGYIYFVSRKDDLVKLNGYRVSPTEIETSLLDCPWISEVCVLCVGDRRLGNVAMAFVVLSTPVSYEELTQWSRTMLPVFMVPARWHVLDKLPVTPNNKIDRTALGVLYITSPDLNET